MTCRLIARVGRRASTRAAGAACVGAALVLGAVACSSSSGPSAGGPSKPGRETTAAAAQTTTAPPERFDGADFYSSPEPLPAGPHGTLIRYAPAPEFGVPGRSAYRLMYLSESVAGEPIVVTGVASVPDAPAPDEGRNLITLGHGTAGLGDSCAPSKKKALELVLAAGFASERSIVVATDYEGLGSPGRHPYLVGESEGRGMVDAALAARQLPRADAGERFAIAGYSQGGHAALWAAQVAPTWAPELQLVGSFSGSPVSDLEAVLGDWPAENTFGFAYQAVAGFEQAYPEADPSEVLTAEGMERLERADDACSDQVFAIFGDQPVKALVKTNILDSEVWRRLATENTAGRGPGNTTPVLVIHSTEDALIPVEMSRDLVQRMCARHQVVEFRAPASGDHAAAAVSAYEEAMAWLELRFASSPPSPTNSCPT